MSKQRDAPSYACGSIPRRRCELATDMRFDRVLDLRARARARQQKKKSARALASSTASALRTMAMIVPVLSWCEFEGGGDGLLGPSGGGEGEGGDATAVRVEYAVKTPVVE